MKKFINTNSKGFKFLALFFCLSMAIPQMRADMYIVGGDFEGGWVTNQGTTMTLDNSTGLYTVVHYISGNGYFCFATGRTSSPDDWSGFQANYRRGPSSDGTGVGVGVTTTAHSNVGNSYKFTGSGGDYEFVYNASNDQFRIDHRYYVLGSNSTLWANGWSTSPAESQKMTNNGNGTWTWTASNVSLSAGTITCKAYGTNGTWYGNTSDNGDLSINVPVAGNYDLTINFNGSRVSYVLNAVSSNYYVVGDSTVLFPNQWTVTNATLMTENNGTYSWTASNVHLYANKPYEYKVTDGLGSWHPSGNNASFTVQDGDGYYDVLFTFDGTNVNAVPTPLQADPTYDYDIFVRYEGSQDFNNVYLYAWDALNRDITPAWFGLKFVNMSDTVINGYLYHHVTLTATSSTIGVLFHENGTAQTADLTATPGDNYYTYGGGSTVDGPNDEPDPLLPMYIIGYANTQQWAANAGIEIPYDAAAGYYRLNNVVLTATSQFAFATSLGSNSGDWSTLDAHRFSTTNNNGHCAITDELLDTWLDYQDYVDDNHNWYVTHPGAHDIIVDMAHHRIKVMASHNEMYLSYGVNWNYDNNSVQMQTVDGNIYQVTVEINQGDYLLFSTALSDATAWGAPTSDFEITNNMVGFAQEITEHSTDNYHFTGDTGKYIVVVNKEKKTVTLRKTVDAKEKTTTKIYLQKTPNVTLNPAGGTYHSQTLPGKRGGIFAWNKLNLQTGGAYYTNGDEGPSNYTYDNEVENDYIGNGYLNDLNDTTTADGKKWYGWSVANSICEFYFIRQGNTDLKSQNVLRRSGEVWLTWIDENATSNRQPDAVQNDSLYNVTRNYYAVSASGVSDCATMLEGHYYVYYTNTTGWDSVYCYAWYEDVDTVVKMNGDYPGMKCTFVGFDKDGYEVWCFDFGLIEDMDVIPNGIIFNNGRGAASEGAEGDKYRQQTGDMVFNNGACYDYLGLIYLGNSLNAIINSGIVNGPKYTVEDNLVGVYYDEDALTLIRVQDEFGHVDTCVVHGALYAKDIENYSAKSRIPDGATDYVYDICAHTKTAENPGGSQIQLKRTDYDQSNWVKIILSPNFDNANAKSNGDVTYEGEFDDKNFATAGENYLRKYVNHIIPGHSMSGNLVNNVNPQMHITNIAPPGDESPYENNVYVTTHFNDTVVFSYVHQDWNPGEYKGVYRTVPHLATDEQGNYIQDETGNCIVDYTTVMTDQVYKMFYVAPKPQEIAYITWAVFDHDIKTLGTNAYQGGEPSTPGAFYAPMNWNRTGNLWSDPNDPNAAWGTTYGPYSNGFMQYGAFQVNWSLFEGMSVPENDSNRPQQPWYRIFKPGQAYKMLVLIRYAHGETLQDVEYTAGVYQGSDYNEGPGSHVANAPMRANDTWADMYFTPYDNLDKSKFIVFPLRGSSEDSNGSDMGNVTTVQEVNAQRTVVATRYYNLMGVESDKPFDGINIIVTTYSDGSRSSQKVLR
ncbi:MAG: starch-binding protein [Muribaculaceae bacterium]|nr:starch-binding protein [Muribaculaceae bacterium]